MGKCASVTYKRIATLLSTKREQTYGDTIAWIRCCISFSLLRSLPLCALEVPDLQQQCLNSVSEMYGWTYASDVTSGGAIAIVSMVFTVIEMISCKCI